MDEETARALGIDTSVTHPARRYNYLLGGTDNFAADRESGDMILKVFPEARVSALENRAFLVRAVQYLAAEAGIDQFLDIGTGLPTADNTHEIAQRINPASRVVYVDNDPLIAHHAKALLTSTPEGRTHYLEADLRDPAGILEHPEVREVLDLGRPVGLVLLAVLHFIEGDAQATAIVRQLLDALPSGSHLVVTHVTLDASAPEVRAASDAMQASGKLDAWPRTREQFERFFDGLELVPPGIVLLSDWRPAPGVERPPTPAIGGYAAVGRKP
ncbi:SAM-dependent methyltransferase [Symbioplanes lichenis]|uniref:SAM-dependent methyltransferase n=1 Tax=Symbioplanes lichenis TaxID=1629072 RepID=UPI0027385480|nr:SAM-dependent methyltransferase [Actinoplanes lichenis]